jgi:diaminopimelate epimerase
VIPFTKMQGIGNDFVVLDTLQDPLPATDLPELARRLTHRQFGVGADGLILLERGSSASFRMRMFNPDGSESEMCGNGVRCVARLVREHGHSEDDEIQIETGAGVLDLRLRAEGLVEVDMGPARLTRGEIGMTGPPDERFQDADLGGGRRGTAVGLGNPHLVLFVDDVEAVDLEAVGPELEADARFPGRVNVHFVQAESRETLKVRTWERGAGATLACGTGACASAVAAAETGRAGREVEVALHGGKLWIRYDEAGRVWKTGPAESVFSGWFG